MINVGKMLTLLRKERKLTQQQLADKLGVSKQAISNYEQGKREPDYVMLEAIADELNVPVSMLISREEQRKTLEGIYSTYPGYGQNRQIHENTFDMQLIALLHKLNEEGQDMVMKYTRLLVNSGEYIKSDESELVQAE